MQRRTIVIAFLIPLIAVLSSLKWSIIIRNDCVYKTEDYIGLSLISLHKPQKNTSLNLDNLTLQPI
jgi:hypothetical protein